LSTYSRLVLRGKYGVPQIPPFLRNFKGNGPEMVGSIGMLYIASEYLSGMAQLDRLDLDTKLVFLWVCGGVYPHSEMLLQLQSLRCCVRSHYIIPFLHKHKRST